MKAVQIHYRAMSRTTQAGKRGQLWSWGLLSGIGGLLPLAQAAPSPFGPVALADGGSIASVDALQLLRAAQLQHPQVWDAVSPASPYWLQRSTAQAVGGQVHLQGGQELWLLLPARAQARLLSSTGQDLSKLEAWRSDGSGLLLAQSLHSQGQGRWQVLEADHNLPAADQARLLILRLPPGTTALDFKLHISRHSAFNNLASYPDLLPLSGPSHTLRQDKEAVAQTFSALKPGIGQRLQVQGPARLALRSRALFNADSEGEAAWQLRIERADGSLLGTRSLHAAPEQGQVLELDGQPALLSRLQQAYLELGPGSHDLIIQSDSDALLQVWQARDNLLHADNAHLDLQHGPLADAMDADWSLDAAAVAQATRIGLDAFLPAAARLAADHRQREGAASASTLLQELAKRRDDSPQAQAAARQQAARLQTWRDLLPLQKTAGAERLAWFAGRELREPGARPWGKVLAAKEGQADLHGAPLQALHSARFVALGDDGLSYVLPPRMVAGKLRLAVHAESGNGQELQLQFDDGPVRRLRLSPALDASHFLSSALDAALQWQSLQFGQGASNVLGGSTEAASFARDAEAGPLLAAQVVGLDVPAQARQLKLWRADGSIGADSKPLWAGLQISSGRGMQPGQAEILGALEQQLGIPALLHALSNEAPAEPGQRALDSQLQEVARLLRSEWRNLQQSSTPPQAAGMALSAAQEAGRLQEARQLAAQGQHLPALEAWSSLLQQPQAALQVEARAGQWQALVALGETGLAQQIARQELLYAGDMTLRWQAFRHLQQLALANQDQQAGLALVAAAIPALQESSKEQLQDLLLELVQQLQANGQGEQALHLASLLPARQRPLPLMLGLAVEKNLWQVFSRLQQDLPDAASREYWQAMRAAREGRWPQAQQGFALSAELGKLAGSTLHQSEQSHGSAQAWQTHLTAGLQLQAKLLFAQHAQHIAPALWQEWAAWQAAAPGNWRWREVPGLVQDYAGAVSLYAINRDHYQHAYRSEAAKPVRLQVQGPTRLRLALRPLHSTGQATALDGWAQVHIISGSTAQMLPLGFQQNWPQAGLQVLGQTEAQAGSALWRELELGAGVHELEIGGAHPMLVQVQQARPQWNLPLLPWLKADSVLPPPQNLASVQKPGWFGCRTCHQILTPGGRTLLQTQPLAHTSFAAQDQLWQAQRAPHKLHAEPVSNLGALLAQPQALTWERLLAQPVAATRSAAVEWLSALAWYAGQGHQPTHTVLARASALQAAHPEWLELGSLLERLAHNSDWVPLSSVQASAGLRSRKISGWEPELAATRVRRALLQAHAPQEYLLSGSNRLVLNLVPTSGQRVELSLQQRDVAALPRLPLHARLQLDNGSVQELELKPEAGPQTLRLPLQVGPQVLKIWLKQAWANQFLSVQLKHAPGQSADGKNLIESERFYHVATAQEPLRVQIPGPAWVRIDHWREGRTHSRYALLEETQNSLQLRPRKDEKEGLYRLFVRQAGAVRPLIPQRQVVLQPQAVPAPMLAGMDVPGLAQKSAVHTTAQPPSTTITAITTGDSQLTENKGQAGHLRSEAVLQHLPAALALTPLRNLVQAGALHEDASQFEAGTWSLFASQQNKSQAASVPKSGNRAETGIGASYRYFDPLRHAWYRADVFANKVRQGPGAVGLAAKVLHEPGWADLLLGAQVSVLWSEGRAQGAAQVFVRQTRALSSSAQHQPEARVFLRQSAQAQDAALLGGDATQIAAPSRNLGLSVSDKFSYAPWQDGLFSAQLSLQSGASLLPDVAHAQFNWQQMLGANRFGVRYTQSSLRQGNQVQDLGKALRLQVQRDYWLPQQQRLEFGVFMQRDLNRRQWSAGVGLTLHLSRDRAYRDFGPDEIVFRELRQRRAPQAPASMESI